ncbi:MULTISPECIES: hypothetical protein [Methylobacterium]|uniref:hypothetical protein n=1 Tax=Methylobacterium TaxID=407 RepID=UPI001650C5BD|nr:MULTISPECIES: hypothetical protein [Methylobacterium]
MPLFARWLAIEPPAGALVSEHGQVSCRQNESRNHESDEDLPGIHGLRLRKTRRPNQCRPAAAQNQIPAKIAVQTLMAGADGTPKLTAVIGVTTPTTMNATATLLSPVARSFACSL